MSTWCISQLVAVLHKDQKSSSTSAFHHNCLLKSPFCQFLKSITSEISSSCLSESATVHQKRCCRRALYQICLLEQPLCEFIKLIRRPVSASCHPVIIINLKWPLGSSERCSLKRHKRDLPGKQELLQKSSSSYLSPQVATQPLNKLIRRQILNSCHPESQSLFLTGLR